MAESLFPFIIIMTGLFMTWSVLTSWIRSRSTKSLAAGDRLGSGRQIELLSTENAGLRGQVGRLEERIAVLERIATDPAERTAREIETLR